MMSLECSCPERKAGPSRDFPVTRAFH
ncbi:hypothetical protein SAM23877_4755 [Streptomyces ambofaciens ATCC 23877]|uniref:Uncharacterized protein n=1 Tax=Streptomyces ambofaciens (strain ATCC 23877 / 3486 / DSM 40053 / JCM 4204 / NBRC 12836 / NRRL B-2516) TaxID=278992 RepID=A0A0K2AXD5_STRA7|nr:hypothetical protein SAM23877_4755 [Streptomyces ambofaciens ATCC 23877]